MGSYLPLVSVCVPTYNDGRFLRQCLQSLAAQTYPNLEILVGDDASSDDTPAIVDSVSAESRQPICYMRNPKNLGQFDNVNALIARARGNYVAVYHSDDVYTPQIVEKEVAFLEAHPQVGAVFALDWRIDDAGQITGRSRLMPGVRANAPLRLPDVLPSLLRHKNRILRAPTFLGRAALLQRAGPFRSDYDIAGDFEMWLRLLAHRPIAILDEPLMYYRRGSSQVSSRYQRLRTFEEHFFVIMDETLARQGANIILDRTALTEYTFHRCDDETFRAANLVILGRPKEAAALLKRPYPWRTLAIRTQDIGRRKLRVLLLRAGMRTGLAVGAAPALARLLRWSEYKGQLS
jgi:glycosyltransferase involved in cell wall biosynthesis